MRYREWVVRVVRATVATAAVVVGLVLGVGCAAGGGDGAVCGDHRCDPGEDAWSCAVDCSPAVCGDGVCSVGESTAVCGQDCFCGNATCDLGEDEVSCASDCGGAVCGDGTCQAAENQATCSADCFCGNGSCDQGEDPFTCAEDCQGSYCGDGTCDAPSEDAVTCAVDCGSGCDDVVCDLWPQCGCSGGQKCSFDAADDRACLAAGSTAQSQICTADADCVAGTMCVGSSSADLRCHQFCGTDVDCPGTGGGGVCVISLLDENDQQIPGANLCTTDCNPASTSPVSCPVGWACHLQYVDENADDVPDFFLTDCANDAGTSTTTCDGVSVFCAPGYFCYTDWNECIRTCRVGMGECPAGKSCGTWSDAAIIGTTEYGYCE